MKRTFADRPNWTRVTQKRFNVVYIKNEELSGHLSIIYIDKVSKPLFVDVGDNKLCLANDGFVWTQYFPENCNYALTTMFDEKHEVVQLYFDICNGNMLSPSGMPYYDDLYLDVALLPTGEILLLDEDELKQALLDNEITKEQYELAASEATNLIKYIRDNRDELLSKSRSCLAYMISLSTDIP